MTESNPRAQGSAAVSQLLRSCVQCGLCLPHCATWLGTGNEVQSPRGRLVLLNALYGTTSAATGGATRPDDPEFPTAFLSAFDQCIGCRACETACPSGVPFSLLEHGLEMAAAHPGMAVRPAVPGSVLRQLDRARFLRFLSRAGYLVRGFIKVVAGGRWRRRFEDGPGLLRRFGRLLGSMPRAPRADRELVSQMRALGLPAVLGGLEGVAGAPADSAGEVVFFRGCANAGFLPDTSRRLVELLRWAGYRVIDPDGQQCCGALANHTGRPGRAASLRAVNDQVFAPAVTGGAVMIVEAAGCGYELKKQPDQAPMVRDAVEFLASIDLPKFGGLPLKVALHDPCHARHGQGLVAEPRRVLAQIPGLESLDSDEAEVCCGSGGAWGLRYPDLSEALGRRKAGYLAATGADIIVTSNPGCLGQIADGLELVEGAPPIIPLTDLLWYAASLAGK